ncbi:hypothetical protein [Limosilactobacillus reuteri]|uniref:hypothetical protein n=1 Tax=Limosilactobacillus reuteri TaxID=1598 RepID=UPI0015E84D50|nr:hypothetical protein [Limosilactobacillus reuteri]MCH5384678.1 hypothetical protein [Limosilactobacillus reuteri]
MVHLTIEDAARTFYIADTMREINISYVTQKRTTNLEKYLIQLIDDGKPTSLDK